MPWTPSAASSCAGSRDVTDARRIYRLQIAVGLVGAATTVLALVVVLSSVSLRVPSAEALARACGAFVLPQVTVASAVVLALGSLAFAVLLLAARSALRQLRDSRRALVALRIQGPAPVGPPGTLVFAGAAPQAFCAGLWRPRLYLSDATLAALTDGELDAVLAHEQHHLRHRDPLRIFFARVLSDALFFLPVLRRLSERYTAMAELAADAAAVRRTNDPAPLASALLSFEDSLGPAVVGIAPERVDHLLGTRPRWELPVALLAWAAVVVLALVAVAVRAEQATAHASVSLPLVAAQLCMFTMAVAPVMLGAAVVLGSRRLLARPRAR
jgi:Zn-dependent protease with chaperone function